MGEPRSRKRKIREIKIPNMTLLRQNIEEALAHNGEFIYECQTCHDSVDEVFRAVRKWYAFVSGQMRCCDHGFLGKRHKCQKSAGAADAY